MMLLRTYGDYDRFVELLKSNPNGLFDELIGRIHHRMKTRYTVIRRKYADSDLDVGDGLAGVRSSTPGKRCTKPSAARWGDPPGSDLEPIAVFAGWLGTEPMSKAWPRFTD